jgi:hypothetical protein
MSLIRLMMRSQHEDFVKPERHGHTEIGVREPISRRLNMRGVLVEEVTKL